MENNVVGFRNVSLRITELGANCLHNTSFRASNCMLREDDYDDDDFDDK